MRKLKRWTPEEASTVYWLTLWGLNSKEVTELSAPVLTHRSLDSIRAFATDARKFISLAYKVGDVVVKPNKTQMDILRKSSKIEPVKEIRDLKPIDLSKVNFKASGTIAGSTHKIHKVNYEQLPPGETNVKGIGNATKDKSEQLDIPFKQATQEGKKTADVVLRKKELSLEEVLKIAKGADAKKVEWNGYIIKFK